MDQMRKLIEQLNYYTKCYDEGHPEIPDMEWDKLYFELDHLEKGFGFFYPDSPTQNIHYEVISELKKVEHDHKMLSLDKTKDWEEFKKYFGDKEVILMPKMDGLTCSLRYENGELVSAQTRGNGLIGEDITHNAQVIKSIPRVIPYKQTLVVDGEIICTKKNFEEFSNDYANPRNFAAGSIRLLDSKECSRRNLDFIAWNIIQGFDEKETFRNKLFEVMNCGFKIIPFCIMGLDDKVDDKEFLVTTANRAGYPIDGLVGRFDDIKYGTLLGETSHHANAAYAFKFYDETVISTVTNIEWTMGRKGALTPVVCFEPVELEGATISRASAHNVSILSSLGIHIGDRVEIYRANQIIPQILTNLDKHSEMSFITECPCCGAPTTIKKENESEEMYCTNLECQGMAINRIDHFAGKSGLDIHGLSKATLEKLIDLGWINNCEDLFTLKDHKAEWVRLPGFGPKSVTNILDAIENSKNTTLDKFICAIGIPLVQKSVVKDLVKKFTTWEEFRNITAKDLLDIGGIGEVRIDKIINFNYDEADRIYKLLNISETKKVVNNSLQDMNICITGKLTNFKNRDELVAAIEFRGGKVTSSVSSKTKILINNDKNSQTQKNVKAKELGIPILNESEFMNQYLI